MGDLRFQPSYARIRDAPNRIAALRSLTNQEVIEALAGASATADPLFANFLATEALNRLQRAQRVLEHIREGVLATDRAGNVTLLNPAAERMLGYIQSEAAGLDINDVLRVRPMDAADEMMHVNLLQEGMRAEGFRLSIAQLEGRWPRRMTAALRATPIYFGEDTVGIVVTIEDVAPLQDAQAAKDALLALSEGVEEGVIATDLEGRVLLWSSACERLYGFAAREATGRLARDLIFPPDSRAEENSMPQAVREGARIRHENSVRIRKDGARVHVSVTFLPVRDSAGRVTGAISLQHERTRGHASHGGGEIIP